MSTLVINQIKDSLSQDSLLDNNSANQTYLIIFVIGIVIFFIILFIAGSKKKEIRSEDIPYPRPISAHKLEQKKAHEIKPISKPIDKPIAEKKINPPRKIGYKPVSIFNQKDPVYFPIILMPKPESWIKLPHKHTRQRNIGIAEKQFKEQYLYKYFPGNLMFDDRILNISVKAIFYEPDVTYQNEKNNLNLFIDIEIDEPYDGIGTPIHYSGSDDQRNYDFNKRGWIVIRFAESQIIRQPDSCCKVIAEVIDAVAHLGYLKQLEDTEELETVRQWSKEEALHLKYLKYRENYLGRTIGTKDLPTEQTIIEETEDGKLVEDELKKTPDEPVKKEYKPTEIKNPDAYNKVVLINQVIKNRAAIRFQYVIDNKKTLVKNIKLIEKHGKKYLSGYCLLKNKEREFAISDIMNLEEVEKPILLELNKIRDITVTYDRMENIKEFNKAIFAIGMVKKMAIIHYTKSNGEKSVRTVSNINKPSEDQFYESLGTTKEQFIEQWGAPSHPEKYIIGYCNLREYVGRTFKIERIDKLIVIDL